MAQHEGTKTCRANAVNKPTSGACKCVSVGRGTRQKHFWRCKNRKLRAHNRSQCRKGPKGRRSFSAKQFTKCRR